MLATDIVWTIEGSEPNAGTYRGDDAFMARAVRPLRLRTPVRPVSKRVWADGDHVIINWEGEAVARPYRPEFFARQRCCRMGTNSNAMLLANFKTS